MQKIREELPWHTALTLLSLSLPGLILAAVATGYYLPLDCGMLGGSFSCTLPGVNRSLLLLLTLPFLLPALFLFVYSLVEGGENPSRRRKAALVGGGVALLLSLFATASLPGEIPVTGTSLHLLLTTLSGAGLFVTLLDLHALLKRENTPGTESLPSGASGIPEMGRALLQNREIFAPPFLLLALFLAVAGSSGALASHHQQFRFHYYLMMQYPESDQVHYYSGDKAYWSDYEIQAKELFLHPRFGEEAFRSSRIKMVVAEEAHLQIQEGTSPRDFSRAQQGVSPYLFAHRPRTLREELLYAITGINPSGRVVAEVRKFPVVEPSSGELVREGAFGTAKRESFPSPGTDSTGYYDLLFRLDRITVPDSPGEIDLSHLFEYYFFDGQKSQQAYYQIFPHSLEATLSVRAVPLLKLLWAGGALLVTALLIILSADLYQWRKRKEIMTPEEKA